MAAHHSSSSNHQQLVTCGGCYGLINRDCLDLHVAQEIDYKPWGCMYCVLKAAELKRRFPASIIEYDLFYTVTEMRNHSGKVHPNQQMKPFYIPDRSMEERKKNLINAAIDPNHSLLSECEQQTMTSSHPLPNGSNIKQEPPQAAPHQIMDRNNSYGLMMGNIGQNNFGMTSMHQMDVGQQQSFHSPNSHMMIQQQQQPYTSNSMSMNAITNHHPQYDNPSQGGTQQQDAMNLDRTTQMLNQFFSEDPPHQPQPHHLIPPTIPNQYLHHHPTTNFSNLHQPQNPHQPSSSPSTTYSPASNHPSATGPKSISVAARLEQQILHNNAPPHNSNNSSAGHHPQQGLLSSSSPALSSSTGTPTAAIKHEPTKVELLETAQFSSGHHHLLNQTSSMLDHQGGGGGGGAGAGADVFNQSMLNFLSATNIESLMNTSTYHHNNTGYQQQQQDLNVTSSSAAYYGNYRGEPQPPPPQQPSSTHMEQHQQQQNYHQPSTIETNNSNNNNNFNPSPIGEASNDNHQQQYQQQPQIGLQQPPPSISEFFNSSQSSNQSSQINSQPSTTTPTMLPQTMKSQTATTILQGSTIVTNQPFSFNTSSSNSSSSSAMVQNQPFSTSERVIQTPNLRQQKDQQQQQQQQQQNQQILQQQQHQQHLQQQQQQQQQQQHQQQQKEQLERAEMERQRQQSEYEKDDQQSSSMKTNQSDDGTALDLQNPVENPIQSSDFEQSIPSQTSQLGPVTEVIQCNLCGVIQERSEKEHLFAVHVSTRDFNCPICDFSHEDIKVVKDHTVTSHSKGRIPRKTLEMMSPIDNRNNVIKLVAAYLNKCFGTNLPIRQSPIPFTSPSPTPSTTPTPTTRDICSTIETAESTNTAVKLNPAQGSTEEEPGTAVSSTTGNSTVAEQQPSGGTAAPNERSSPPQVVTEQSTTPEPPQQQPSTSTSTCDNIRNNSTGNNKRYCRICKKDIDGCGSGSNKLNDHIWHHLHKRGHSRYTCKQCPYGYYKLD